MAKRKESSEQHKQALEEKILSYMATRRGEALNYKEVTEGIGRKSKKDREEVQDLLYELLAAGKICEGNVGCFRLAGEGSNRIVGTVDMTAQGAAFIIPDNPEAGMGDIFVSRDNLATAMHGDKVEVVVYARRKGKQPEGEVIQIIERKRTTYVGVVDINETAAFLVCNAKMTGGHDIYIPINALHGAQDGQKAVARITSWPAKAKNPEGEIIAVLGNVGDNQTEMHAILAEYGLPYSYPAEVAAEADQIEPGITAEEIARRIDFRDVTTFTIDPADAKDFDDAISIRRKENGNWEVGVHIADVTHYVTPGTVIDEEGYNRATSIYLVDRTIPMLPERLSNFLCSLRPDEEKLTFSVIAEMTEEAEIVKSKIAKTVIKSNKRFTYEEAQNIIEGKSDGPFKEEVLTLNDLAQKMRRRRFEAGAVNFDRVEPRFVIDENGKPLNVYFKEAKESNMLVEEMMLMANKRVAEYIGKDELNPGAKKRQPKTFVYRIHDNPSEERYEKFTAFIRRFGLEASPGKDEQISNAVNRVLKEVKGKPEQNLVEVLALRTMAKAVYSTKNIGHYGLAFEYYTHFTSPIRRYPDMMVHRLLWSYINGGRSVNAEKYEEKCKHCTDQEILAADAERDSIKYKQVEFMMDRLGEDFDATVSGVTEWGIYAEIDENKCEGMISIRNLDDDMYEFDEDNYCVVGRGKGKKYQLGDHIRIRIANANLEKKQLDFVLAGSPLTSVEMQNQALRAKGIDPIQHERERALRHASEEKGRGGRHDGRRHDKGGVPSKGRVAASAKKGKKDKKDKKSKGKGKKSKK